MRETKFRLWIKNPGEMYYPEFAGDYYHFHFDGRVDEWDENAPNLDGMENGSWVEMDKDKYELMQYTGLKDKNGKEIYEGDIIQYTWLDSSRGTDIAVVYWDEKVTGFEAKSKTLLYGLDQCNFQTIKGSIIGNIYENKDLLK